MTSNRGCPVAGCSPSTHRQAADYHHRWLVVDASGQWLTPHVCPALSEVTTDIKMGYLVLRAPGMLRMDIPLDVIEDDDSVLRDATIGAQKIPVVDEGDLAAVWFGHVTNQACRLVKVHPEAKEIDWPV
ncbi:MAG: MOSC N-terminal beta barrel domain-containing protein [Sheuella sp.]|nr:MOSC N-terminal beta barrel domain-containing protein [Sheuella sp.]